MMAMSTRKSQLQKVCMKNFFQWILLSGVVFSVNWGCASVGVSNPTEFPVGVVDPQRILLETDKGQQLSDILGAFMKDRQALVELEQKELRKLENELMAQSTILSQQARERKEEQFRQKMAGYQQKVADLNREVQEKQRELQNEFRGEVQKVVSKIASRRGLGLVVEQGVNSGTLYYRPDLDISTDIIQALNQERGTSSSP
jgi:outer membrane protein